MQVMHLNLHYSSSDTKQFQNIPLQALTAVHHHRLVTLNNDPGLGGMGG